MLAVMRPVGCLVLYEDLGEWSIKAEGKRENTHEIWFATRREGANEEAQVEEFFP